MLLTTSGLCLALAVHHVLESTEPSDDVVIEERLFTKINGWVLSGAVDHQVIKGQTVEITDYKVTSVWSVIHGKIDWERQLNVYAYLVQKNKGKKVKSYPSVRFSETGTGVMHRTNLITPSLLL